MKLLIVDDELQIRTGLAEEINWFDLGIEKTYIAENGIDAVELCETHHPEIIITDIRMPGIDGLELSRQVTELYNPVNIIILTGYSDFEYAKEAIKFGALAYLLKPVNIKELTDIVIKSIESIKYELELFKNKSLFEQMSRKEKLKSLIDFQGELDDEKILIFKELTSIRITDFTLVGLLSLDIINGTNVNQIGIYLKSIFEEIMVEQPTNMLYWNDNTLLFTCHYKANLRYDKIKDIFNDRLHQMNQMLKAQFNSSVSLALSSLRGIKYLPEMYLECTHCMKHRLYLGKKSFLDSKQLNKSTEAWISPLNTSEFERVIELFENKKTQQYIEKLFTQLCEMKVTSSDFVRGICINMKKILIEMIQEKGINSEQLIKDYPMLVKETPLLTTLKDYYMWINNLYYVVLDKFSKLGGAQHSRIIIQTVDYISNHYNEDISLTLLAEYTGKSKNYLGYLFKKEMNVSFIDYLNDIRIGEAKKRLRNSDDMIYEISEAVGFSDYKYFSSIFKKYSGISPIRYRKNNEI